MEAEIQFDPDGQGQFGPLRSVGQYEVQFEPNAFDSYVVNRTIPERIFSSKGHDSTRGSSVSDKRGLGHKKCSYLDLSVLLLIIFAEWWVWK